jgi:hypothetical protein
MKARNGVEKGLRTRAIRRFLRVSVHICLRKSPMLLCREVRVAASSSSEKSPDAQDMIIF